MTVRTDEAHALTKTIHIHDVYNFSSIDHNATTIKENLFFMKKALQTSEEKILMKNLNFHDFL